MKLIDRLNPTKLAESQDLIIEQLNKVVVGKDIQKYIDILESFDILFKIPLLYFPKNNLYIRNKFLLSTLYFLKGDKSTSSGLGGQGITAFLNYVSGGYYIEKFSYFEYVIVAYELYTEYVQLNPLGNVIDSIRKNFYKIADPNGTVPVGDSRDNPIDVRLVSQDENYSDDSFTVIRRKNFYCLIVHDEKLLKYKNNLHIDWNFGDIIVWKDGVNILKFNYYTGFKDKKFDSSDKNIILGLFNKEKFWRFLPFQSLKYQGIANLHTMYINNSASRSIAILSDRIVIKDLGGECSVFNVDRNSNGEIYVIKGEQKNEVGTDKIKKYVYGQTRVIYIHF